MPVELERKKCKKCGKTLKISSFYRKRDGEYLDLCKACYTMHMDCFEPETFLWALEECDIPYIPSKWNSVRDKYFDRDPDNINVTAIFGRYLSVMCLNQWKKYGWADTERLQEELNDKYDAQEAAERKQREEELRMQKEAGEISDAQYQTYMSTEAQYEEYQTRPPASTKEAIGADNYYKEEDFLDLDELPDPAAGLTKKDQIWLVMKWGNMYKPDELLSLEKKYNEMIRDFDVSESDTESTLILLCKTYLKMNQAIDANDTESYKKYASVYDSLRKSAKFTAAQKKEQEKDFIDCVGNLVLYCEKTKGKIPRYDTSIDYDVFDKVIKDLKSYNKSLIYEDKSLARQIEDYLKKLDIQQKRKAAEKEAQEKGIRAKDLPITEEERAYQSELLLKQKQDDEKIYRGEI